MTVTHDDENYDDYCNVMIIIWKLELFYDLNVAEDLFNTLF